jgi:dephospho-CoA kinase
MRARTAILRAGLTGNIAAGKSTVAGWMAELGCHVLDADRLAHECLAAGEPTHDAVVAAFADAGSAARELILRPDGEIDRAAREPILRPDGEIDRAALGRIVFADPAARRRLEAILHPAIRDREARHIEQIAAGTDAAIVVTEAALLYETGGAARYHRMIVVTAPDAVRLRRLQASGLDAEEARRRMQSQMPQDEKAARADYVVDNGGTLDATRQITEKLVAHLHEDLDLLRGGTPLGLTRPLD